ncbi:hypothetical protein N9098_01615 [bacterium]|nr:hypothetical protein [bacterium]
MRIERKRKQQSKMRKEDTTNKEGYKDQRGEKQGTKEGAIYVA